MDDDHSIRKFLGWVIDRTVVDVTAGDPKEVPDADPEDEDVVTLHFDNGGTLMMPIGDAGFRYHNPDDEDEDS